MELIIVSKVDGQFVEKRTIPVEPSMIGFVSAKDYRGNTRKLVEIKDQNLLTLLIQLDEKWRDQERAANPLLAKTNGLYLRVLDPETGAVELSHRMKKPGWELNNSNAAFGTYWMIYTPKSEGGTSASPGGPNPYAELLADL